MKVTKPRFIFIILFAVVLVIAITFIIKKLLKPSLTSYPQTTSKVEKDDAHLNKGLNCFYDFETTEDIPCKVFDKHAYSGQYCLKMDENTEYSVAFVKSVR